MSKNYSNWQQDWGMPQQQPQQQQPAANVPNQQQQAPPPSFQQFQQHQQQQVQKQQPPPTQQPAAPAAAAVAASAPSVSASPVIVRALLKLGLSEGDMEKDGWLALLSPLPDDAVEAILEQDENISEDREDEIGEYLVAHADVGRLLSTVKAAALSSQASLALFCEMLGRFCATDRRRQNAAKLQQVVAALAAAGQQVASDAAVDRWCRCAQLLAQDPARKQAIGTAPIRDAIIHTAAHASEGHTLRFWCGAIIAFCANNPTAARLLTTQSFVDALMAVGRKVVAHTPQQSVCTKHRSCACSDTASTVAAEWLNAVCDNLSAPGTAQNARLLDGVPEFPDLLAQVGRIASKTATGAHSFVYLFPNLGGVGFAPNPDGSPPAWVARYAAHADLRSVWESMRAVCMSVARREPMTPLLWGTVGNMLGWLAPDEADSVSSAWASMLGGGGGFGGGGGHHHGGGGGGYGGGGGGGRGRGRFRRSVGGRRQS